MRTAIIQFVSGNADQIQQLCPVPTNQQRIILNTTTGRAYWDYAGQRFSISTNAIPADWDQTDTEALDYIKNKPVIPEDINDLTDSSKSISVYDQDLPGYTLVYTTTSPRMPAGLTTPQGKFYTIEGDSITAITATSITIDLNRYYAYQNKSIPQAGWKLIYR